MHNIILTCLTAESDHIGRFDPSLLIQQARMELLVQHLPNKHRLYTDEGDFKPISEWPGVTVNANDEVTNIVRPWNAGDLYAGTVEFQWLPATVETISLVYGAVEGIFRAIDFPRKTTEIVITGNKLTGCIETANLPDNLRELNLMSNRISGTINLCTLPNSLESLALARNSITGKIDLQHLPQALCALNIRSNALSGGLIARNLPSHLQKVNISSNNFFGNLEVDGDAFETLRELRATECNFRKVIFGGTLPKDAVFEY